MCIVAVAARHFANTNRSFDHIEDVSCPQFVNANLDALHFKRKAIKALSSSLNCLEPSQQDVIMPAILLLIFLDLLESGIDGWRYHLQGAEGLMNFSNTLLEPTANDCINNGPGKTAGQTRRFVARQFSLYGSSFLHALMKSPDLWLTTAVFQPLEVHCQAPSRDPSPA